MRSGLSFPERLMATRSEVASTSPERAPNPRLHPTAAGLKSTWRPRVSRNVGLTVVLWLDPHEFNRSFAYVAALDGSDHLLVANGQLTAIKCGRPAGSWFRLQSQLP